MSKTTDKRIQLCGTGTGRSGGGDFVNRHIIRNRKLNLCAVLDTARGNTTPTTSFEAGVNAEE